MLFLVLQIGEKLLLMYYIIFGSYIVETCGKTYLGKLKRQSSNVRKEKKQEFLLPALLTYYS